MRKRLARVAGAFVDLGLDALPRSVCPGMRNLCPRRLSIAWLRSTGGLAFKNLGATKLPPGGERQAAVLRDRAVAWRHDRPHRASEMTTAPTPICAACTRLGPTPTASSGTRVRRSRTGSPRTSGSAASITGTRSEDVIHPMSPAAATRLSRACGEFGVDVNALAAGDVEMRGVRFLVGNTCPRRHRRREERTRTHRRCCRGRSSEARSGAGVAGWLVAGRVRLAPRRCGPDGNRAAVDRAT